HRSQSHARSSSVSDSSTSTATGVSITVAVRPGTALARRAAKKRAVANGANPRRIEFSGTTGAQGPRSQFCFKNASPYIGSVTYSSAASEPAFDFDTPLLCWLARIVVSDIADWASSGTDEAVSLSFEGCESPPSDVRRATTAESPMTSDGFVSGPTPSRLAAIVLRRFTKRVDETIARSAIRMMIAP